MDRLSLPVHDLSYETNVSLSEVWVVFEIEKVSDKHFLSINLSFVLIVNSKIELVSSSVGLQVLFLFSTF